MVDVDCMFANAFVVNIIPLMEVFKLIVSSHCTICPLSVVKDDCSCGVEGFSLVKVECFIFTELFIDCFMVAWKDESEVPMIVNVLFILGVKVDNNGDIPDVVLWKQYESRVLFVNHCRCWCCI